MARSARTYQPIQGSARLGTAALSAAASLARAEALTAGEMRRVAFDGELVGAARVRGRCAAIPFEAFDAAGEQLEPEEQGAYFQLLRLSWAEGRNFCRVSKRHLVARLGTTERRLHRILDGLVRKGFVRLLHRDNRGTALRVYLPGESSGVASHDVVLGVVAAADSDSGAPAETAAAAATVAAVATPAAPAATPAAPAPRAVPIADARTRALAYALAAARGAADDGGQAAALDDVRELIADGATPRQIEAAVRAVARRRSSEGANP